MSEIYSEDFYKERNTEPVEAFQQVLATLLQYFPKINSAVDIGCGTGGWLCALKNLGVNEILGIDGDWVPQQQLQIPINNFLAHDLQTSFPIIKKYDLAISLEVAEHLQEDRANEYVDFLCGLSEIILFSAAIPNQGGTHHVNEQWPSYWTKLFRDRGFTFSDQLRPLFWEDPLLPWWYKQNLFIAINSSYTLSDRVILQDNILGLVHPSRFSSYFSQLQNTRKQVYQLEKQLSLLKSESQDHQKSFRELSEKCLSYQNELKELEIAKVQHQKKIEHFEQNEMIYKMTIDELESRDILFFIKKMMKLN